MSPSWCLRGSDLAVTAVCRTLPRDESLLLWHSLVGASCPWRPAGFRDLGDLALKIVIQICIVTSSASWALGAGQGQRELLRGTVNLRAVDLNLFCRLTMQEESP